MSVCTFLASDYPLPEVSDDNYFLLNFRDASDYTDKKYAVYLEWNYTDGRAKQIIEYIRMALEKSELLELWHVWLMDYYEYEDSPVIHKRTVPIEKITIWDIYELNHADIWNTPDKYIPSRPSFYCLKITRK